MSDKSKRYEEITKKYGDPWIWGIYFTLIILSIVESYSASSREVAAKGVYIPIIKQCFFLAAGAAIVVFLYRKNYFSRKFLFVMIPLLSTVTLLCLVYVMFFGEVINGAQRAISLMGFTLQPAELAKLSIVTVLAYILARNQKNKDVSTFGMTLSAIVVAMYGGLMIKSGLTNTLLLMCISGSMMLIGGAKVKKIAYVIVLYVIVFGLFMLVKGKNDAKDANLNAVENVAQSKVLDDDDANDDNAVEGKGDAAFLKSADSVKAKQLELNRKSTWKNRIQAWSNRDSLVYAPVTSKNQQEMFSRMAQAHGGITGVGIGNSRECSRLPLAFSDYIFSIIVEEMGFIGGVFVIILYLWLLARAAMIARKCTRVLPTLLIIGMASMIAFQALFHIAINVGVFPVSGQPLPLVSMGGTSILVNSIAFGIMLSVSRTIANYNKNNNKVEDSQLPGSLNAENPSQILPKNEWK